VQEGRTAGGTAPRVLTVVGARPQFVKAAVVSLAIRSRGIRERILHTGQHYDPEMSEVFFRQMGIPREDHQLGVGSGTHGEQTARVILGVERVLMEEPADAVLVFGDTNSTVAGALAAAKLHVPVAHVEAGMRSFNRRMPEELNRVVTDHLATWHYCSTPVAEENLRREGIREGIVRTGDVMADAVMTFAPRAPFPPPGVPAPPGPFGVVTCHRAENTDDPDRLEAILEGLARAARRVPLWFPMHPRTRERLGALGRTLPPGVAGLPAVPYLEMLGMISRAAVVVTDSGGIQKEAYLLGVPCVTLREETEWVESVRQGANRLAGADADRIEAAVGQALDQGPLAADRPSLYGDGRAAERVADHLASVLGTGGAWSS